MKPIPKSNFPSFLKKFQNSTDMSPAPYETNVTLLKAMHPKEENPEDPKYITYDVEAPPTVMAPAEEQQKYEDEDVSFEDPECTLVWSFQTPAIYPKPNVTCGYYSFDHDDVVHYLPAGLTLHKFMNQTWKASFQNTRVQVRRKIVTLRCSEVHFDSDGCPDVNFLGAKKGLVVSKADSHMNCRGQILPSVREGPAIVSLSCPYRQWAHFSDGTKEPNWFMQLSCYEYEQKWRTYHVGDSNKQGEFVDLEEIPMCGKEILTLNSIKETAQLVRARASMVAF
ncbi:hypothetical protein SK128_027926 [Halocaridina rubra]|uniref:Uncharacterized protein n=1 Tax=Halocaridina rubra TaxID=373956 RepID=A0AAN8X6Y1_HALRR